MREEIATTPADVSFSVVVPVCDDLDCLPRTLPGVAQAVKAYGNAELIVVDNGSEDGSYEWLRKRYGGMAKILRLPDVSISAVRNHGARHTDGDVYCFIDADCVVEKTHLEAALRALEESSAAVVGSRYRLPPDAGWIESTWHHLHRTEREGFVDFLSAGNLIVRADAFEHVGGFDEGLVTGEDAELCQRLRDHGYRIYQDPAIVAVHLGNPKTLLGFFRKQRWYALGMFGTVRRSSIDKPVVAMLVHLLAVSSAGGMLFVTSATWGARVVLVAAAVLLVPALAAMYRWWQVGRVIRPMTSLLLYEIFFAARITAATLLLTGVESEWRPEREGTEAGVGTAYEFEGG